MVFPFFTEAMRVGFGGAEADVRQEVGVKITAVFAAVLMPGHNHCYRHRLVVGILAGTRPIGASSPANLIHGTACPQHTVPAGLPLRCEHQQPAARTVFQQP